MTRIRRVILSLVVGCIFGLTLSTKYPDPIAAVAGLVVAVLVYGAWYHSGRSERREPNSGDYLVRPLTPDQRPRDAGRRQDSHSTSARMAAPYGR